MKAVMYGGGNIGRGFVGMLMSQSGYQVTFVDVAKDVVKKLSSEKCYPLRYVSNDGYEDIMVENVTAVDGNDMEEVAEAIAECDIMATAVGVRILKYIVPNIVEGIRRRWSSTDKTLNIIICENLIDANKLLEKMVKEQLSEEERKKFDRTVGLVEASIGRMVPVQTEEMKDGELLRVCVEKYGFLPTDKDAFIGEIPYIKNMVPASPFDFYIKRKLYVHNMGHAVCAYLGNVLGKEYIYQSIDVPEVRIIVENAMLESAMALSETYHMELEPIIHHISDLLYRFSNRALKDTCQRVGGDPERKLSPDDRLIGAAKLVLDRGECPAYISVGIAAGVRRYLSEKGEKEFSRDKAENVLSKLSGLNPACRVYPIVLEFFDCLREGKQIEDICRIADKIKNTRTEGVI